MVTPTAPARNTQERGRTEVLTNGQILLNGRRTGCTIRGALLVREASEAAHLLRKPPAWAYNVEVIDCARSHGCKGLVVHCSDTGRTWHCSMGDFTARCETLDRGYGQQYALALRHWQREEAPVTAAPVDPDSETSQPALLDLAAVEAPRRGVYA